MLTEIVNIVCIGTRPVAGVSPVHGHLQETENAEQGGGDKGKGRRDIFWWPTRRALHF